MDAEFIILKLTIILQLCDKYLSIKVHFDLEMSVWNKIILTLGPLTSLFGAFSDISLTSSANGTDSGVIM